MKKKMILLILLSFPILSIANDYFNEDKMFFFSDSQNLLIAKEKIAKKEIIKKFQNGLIKKETALELSKYVDISIQKDKKLINEKYNSFLEYAMANYEECDFKNTSYLEKGFFYHGLWHLEYINKIKSSNSESNVAVIDGYLSNNRLLPNLGIKNCMDLNFKSCNQGLDMTNKNSNDIFKNHGDHTYWVSSIIAGQNCGNSKSSLKVSGVNPMANLLIVNVSKYENRENKHSIKKMTEAIQTLSENDINVIYIPLSFKNYSTEEKTSLEDAISIFLSKPNRAIVSVFGNNDSVSKDDAPIPCIIDGVICVGGLDRNGTIWKNTFDIEEYISVFAPAADIIGGVNKDGDRIKNDGVSASGAIVAGMISSVIKNENYIVYLNNIKKGKKAVLKKDGTIFYGKRGVSY